MVYGLDHNGDRGKVKGLKNKEKFPFPYDRELWPGMGGPRACVFAFGYGAEGWRVSYRTHTLPFSPTHPYGRKETEATKRDKKQAGEESWLK